MLTRICFGIVAVAAAASLLLSGCGGTGADVGSNTAAAAARAPRDVVAAYLTALNEGDPPAALGVATPRFQEVLEHEVDTPLTNWLSVTDVRLGVPRHDAALASARRHRFVLYVPADFKLQQREEVSMRDGPTHWGYVVVRDAPGDPWRIDDQGVG